jgi:excisionase family DNA binding protein
MFNSNKKQLSKFSIGNEILAFLSQIMDEKNNSQFSDRNLSRTEVSQLLGVSVRTIDTLLKENRLQHVRIKGRILIPYDAVLQFNRNNIIKANEPTAQSGEGDNDNDF